MRKIIPLLTALLFVGATDLKAQSENYKEMLEDYSFNFYEVVDAADQYFETHGTGKGSGYKNYQRWKHENEGKFFPSGRRDHISPFFVEDGWQKIISELPKEASRAGNKEVWEDLGPYDANVITSHYSQGIGRVEAVYVDPQNDQKMYLGSRSGGFWLSLNGGSTWKCSTDTMIATGVNTIAVSPSNSDSVLINVRNAKNGYSHGIYRSADGGNTWTQTNFNPANLGWGGLGKTGQISVIAISPHNPQLVFVGSDRGLYRSTDNLNNFSQIVSGNYTQVDFHPTNSNIIYAYDRNTANRSVVMRSTNGGSSFNASSTIPSNGNNNGRLSVSKACASCVYFSSNDGVWKSKDEGVNFTFISNPNESSGGFAVSDTDTSRMIYGYVDLTASSDGGANFNQVTYWSTGNSQSRPNNYVHADLRIVSCVNGVFYIGTDGYMAKSADGGITWERLNDGTGIREFYRLGVCQSNKDLTMAGSQDNGTSIYTSNGWIEWNGGDGMEAICHTLNQEWMIGSWQYGNRNRTTNGGQSRQNVKHPGSPDWNAPMFYNPNHQFEVFSFSNVVFSSEEFGDNWTGRSSISTSVMKKASVAENNPNIMLFVRNSDLWLSTDGGYSTTSMTNNLPHGASISDVAFHPNNDSIVVMVYETYQDNNRRVYYSDDLCQTWSNISYNLSPMPANDVVLDDKGNIYVAAEIGIYTMPINGSIWKLHGEGFPNVSFEELEIHWATNMLRGVTWGRGMWQAPLVGRSDYPRMSNIEIAQTPSMMTPSEDFPQHVTVKLDYNKKLSRMYLEWSKDSTYFNNSIDLVKLSNGDYVTETPIPSFAAGTDMYFKVFAIGADNDTTTSYKFNYTYRTCNNARNVTARASKTTICKGEGITLSALGATDYLWNEGVYASETQFPEKTRTYTVRGWSDGTCAGIDSIEVVVNSVDTGVSESELNFTAHETNASYQWLDCENNKAAIAGATQQTFTGLSAGSYAVALEKLGCKDTSACVVAPILSLNEIGEHNTVTVYPNPTSGVLLLQSEELIFHAEVLDVAGKLFFKSNENSKNVEINLEGLPKGTYLLNLKTESGSSVHKILKMESR